MSLNSRRQFLVRAGVTGAAMLANAAVPPAARAASAQSIAANCRKSLSALYVHSDKARELGDRARAVLIFPHIVKAGFVVGGQGGTGALFLNGESDPVGYYQIAAASFGLQAGAQAFSYALFFITESSLDFLRKSDGWSIGSGPSVVVIDQGMAKSMTSTTLTQDVYAIPFGQKGLMAGLGLEGSKISQIHPGE
jgi:lipid-binding SYLF domain-containing protein